MTHHHHHHHHDHDHDIESTLSFEEKLIKLLQHWIKHNDDHVKTYLDWAQKAKENDLNEANSMLENAAEETKKISRIFEQAARHLKKS